MPALSFLDLARQGQLHNRAIAAAVIFNSCGDEIFGYACTNQN
jgi:hypothetical protein